MASINQAIEFMRKACDDWSLGYDQSNRWDVKDWGETDCSALVLTALKRSGFDIGDATYTGNMSYNLTRRGWKRISANLSDARPGDILLNDAYHTAMVISGKGWNARIAQASIDENGRIMGGKAGDQTGYETNTRGIYTYSKGWNCILRYKDAPSPSPAPSGKLDVDGIGGYYTIYEWQNQLGTTTDGVISGQYLINRPYIWAFTMVEWDEVGSQMVRAMQKRIIKDGFSVGPDGADGYFGQGTAFGLQEWLCAHGYKVDVDGYCGTQTVKGVQRSLNDKKWV